MKSIRYSVAALALLVAVSIQAAPSHALTPNQTSGKVTSIVQKSDVLFRQTAEERAVSNLERSIAQKENTRAALQAELAASYVGLDGFAGGLTSGQRTIDELNRQLFEDSPNMTSQEYQSRVNSLNRAKSSLLTLQREASLRQSRQNFLLREIDRKNNDIANLEGRLVDAKSLASGSRTHAIVEAGKDLVLDEARKKAVADRNEAVRQQRKEYADANRRTSVGYKYEAIQRKQGTVNSAPAPYSRASGSARTRQEGGGAGSTDGGYTLDLSQQ